MQALRESHELDSKQVMKFTGIGHFEVLLKINFQLRHLLIGFRKQYQIIYVDREKDERIELHVQT